MSRSSGINTDTIAVPLRISSDLEDTLVTLTGELASDPPGSAEIYQKFNQQSISPWRKINEKNGLGRKMQRLTGNLSTSAGLLDS